LHCFKWNPAEKLVLKLINMCCLLYNIKLQCIVNDVPLVGHHDEDGRQQKNLEVVSSEAKGILS
jgi:hypothetical protein